MDLRGSVALVTGAASPIGTAVSVRLASLGASVAVLDRRPAAVAHRIAAAGGHVLALTADIEDPDSVRAAIGRLMTAWERIDIVVTGPGSRPPGPSGSDWADGWADSWKQLPEAGLRGLVTVSRAVAGYLPDSARTGARGVADLVVINPAGPTGPIEAAAERAVEAFCHTLARELAGQSVRVSLVAEPAESQPDRSEPDQAEPDPSGQAVAEAVLRLIGRPARIDVLTGSAG
ncbi:MAG: SDR family NAD(P)-dependent oxidoreductase [Jatrophihabitantaceae bacterium]